MKSLDVFFGAQLSSDPQTNFSPKATSTPHPLSNSPKGLRRLKNDSRARTGTITRAPRVRNSAASIAIMMESHWISSCPTRRTSLGHACIEERGEWPGRERMTGEGRDAKPLNDGEDSKDSSGKDWRRAAGMGYGGSEVLDLPRSRTLRIKPGTWLRTRVKYLQFQIDFGGNYLEVFSYCMFRKEDIFHSVITLSETDSLLHRRSAPLVCAPCQPGLPPSLPSFSSCQLPGPPHHSPASFPSFSFTFRPFHISSPRSIPRFQPTPSTLPSPGLATFPQCNPFPHTPRRRPASNIIHHRQQ